MNVGIGTRLHSFISGNICFQFSVQCLCSAESPKLRKIRNIGICVSGISAKEFLDPGCCFFSWTEFLFCTGYILALALPFHTQYVSYNRLTKNENFS